MDLVYGPYSSRRYGSTLGINLLGPQKVSSYDCIYSSLGPTTLTMNKIRKDYIFPSLDEVRQAFKAYIAKSVPMQAIVVAGNGEPTLYPEFTDAMNMILELRQAHLPQAKVIVLTNGAHLDNKKVVNGLNLIDERVIAVDAGNDALMAKINNPLIRINMAKFLSGLRKLNDLTVAATFFTGEVDNTTPEMLDEWIEVVGMIKPKTVQLLTLNRPTPMMPSLKALDEDALYSIAFKLKKRTSLEATVFATKKA